jgi:AraC family transcriptional activator FtrA
MKDHVVAALVYEDLAFFELAVAVEVFGLRRPELGVDWYDFRVCSARPGPVTTTGGLQVQAPFRLRTLARADTVIVPGWHPLDAAPADDVLAAIRAAHARGARILSVCSGAFVLAAAGLLDGRTATTHWMYADDLARRYPAVRVDPTVLYIDDGDVMTSAGTAAGIDLCLHVVRQDHGAEVANMVARRMVVPPHRDGGQAQFVHHPVTSELAGDGDLHDVLAWMTVHLDEPLAVEDLARRAHMSPRTFARRFKAVTGATPHRWLLDQRLLLAQRLLETTDLPIERIAVEAGFGAAVTLRQHFHRWAATSPAAYRRTFRERPARSA